jgi:hypothetical protein
MQWEAVGGKAGMGGGGDVKERKGKANSVHRNHDHVQKAQKKEFNKKAKKSIVKSGVHRLRSESIP